MEFYRGVVRSYDSGTHTATVLLVGSMASVVVAIPVAQQVGPEAMVEGAACGVLFSRGGASGVVVCTLGGPAVEPLLAGVYSYGDDGTNLVVTTSWQTVPGMSMTVTPTAGQTWTLVLMAGLHLTEAAGVAATTNMQAQWAQDGTKVGMVSETRLHLAWDNVTVPLFYRCVISAAATFTLQARKLDATGTFWAAREQAVILAYRTV